MSSKRSRRSVCRRLLMIIPCVLAPTLSLAQQDQGVITGRVTDASGAVLPGVTIMATRVATRVASQAVTSAEGLYTIPALPIGTYRVVAEVPGFKRMARESIRSTVSAPRQMQFGLKFIF